MYQWKITHNGNVINVSIAQITIITSSAHKYIQATIQQNNLHIMVKETSFYIFKHWQWISEYVWIFTSQWTPFYCNQFSPRMFTQKPCHFFPSLAVDSQWTWTLVWYHGWGGLTNSALNLSILLEIVVPAQTGNVIGHRNSCAWMPVHVHLSAFCKVIYLW